jgi:hypothetical protein
MGNYNSQYESYYSRLSGRKTYNGNNSSYPYRYNSAKGNGGIFEKGYFAKRFMNELIGVLCLILIVIMCKIVVIPETQMIYDYSKKMVNQDFNYEEFIINVRNTKYTDLQLYVENLIGGRKAKYPIIN